MFSRDALKLAHINWQYHFLENSRACLGLSIRNCGWLSLVRNTIPTNSTILEINPTSVHSIDGVKTLVGNIGSQKTNDSLKKMLRGTQFDVVLHNGIPNMKGSSVSNPCKQSKVVLKALRTVCEFLAFKGIFITKVFISSDYISLVSVLKSLFEKVETTKPAPSCSSSAEIFICCLGYKSPIKTKPFLHHYKLNNQLTYDKLEELKDLQTNCTRLKNKNSSPCTSVSVVSFIQSSSPIEILHEFEQLTVDNLSSKNIIKNGSNNEIAKYIIKSAKNNRKIYESCNDLRVLNKNEFKLLLKWRLQIREDIKLNFEKHKIKNTDDESRQCDDLEKGLTFIFEKKARNIST
jgi:AdoMet-dependent rRNA methyltransferase SPB1